MKKENNLDHHLLLTAVTVTPRHKLSKKGRKSQRRNKEANKNTGD